MIHYDSKIELDNYLFKGCSVIELGDQFCDWNAESQGMRSDFYFKQQDVHVTSIDWHGNNNVLKLDMNEVLEDKLQGDILTDFGTIEHVKNLYNGLVNCHNFTKENGIMIHVNPAETYTHHGYRYFTFEFWKEFAKACDYALINMYSKPVYNDSNPAHEIFAVLKKIDTSKMICETAFKVIEDKFTGNNE